MKECSQAKPRSTTQRCLPRPEPCATPRRAIRGVMPRARSWRRYVVVVAAVGEQLARSPAGPSAADANRRDGVDQRDELGDVVAVAAGEADGQRDAAGVADQVVLGAGAAAVDR